MRAPDGRDRAAAAARADDGRRGSRAECHRFQIVQTAADRLLLRLDRHGIDDVDAAWRAAAAALREYLNRQSLPAWISGWTSSRPSSTGKAASSGRWPSKRGRHRCIISESPIGRGRHRRGVIAEGKAGKSLSSRNHEQVQIHLLLRGRRPQRPDAAGRQGRQPVRDDADRPQRPAGIRHHDGGLPRVSGQPAAARRTDGRRAGPRSATLERKTGKGVRLGDESSPRLRALGIGDVDARA